MWSLFLKWNKTLNLGNASTFGKNCDIFYIQPTLTCDWCALCARWRKTEIVTSSNELRKKNFYELSLNDVLAVSKSAFYVTNFHYFEDERLQTAELYLGLRLGSVVFFDGKNATLVAQSLSTPTGLALDKSKKLDIMSHYFFSETREGVLGTNTFSFFCTFLYCLPWQLYSIECTTWIWSLFSMHFFTPTPTTAGLVGWVRT